MIVFSRFLRYFVEVARVGSIRRAAEVLNISASAIDRQILRAEEEMGAALFERLPTGLRPTAAGELLLSSAQAWRKDFDLVQARIGDLSGLRRGKVAIVCIEALSSGFIPDLVRRIRAEFPAVSFSLNTLDNVRIAAALIAGEADFGLMLNPQSSKDLTVRAFVEVPVGLVTPPDHPLARQAFARFNQIAGQPMVIPQEPLALADLVRALAQATGVRLDAAAGADNIQMIKSLVQQGVGIGVLSWLDAMTEVRAGSLAFTPLSDKVLKPLTLSLCVVPSRQLSNAALMALSRIEASLSGLKP